MTLKSLVILLIVTLSLQLNASDYQNVIGVGFGVSEEQALVKAKMDAIEKSVGILLSSKSVVENYMTISDKIVSKSNGLIKKYEVLKKIQTTDAIEVEIKADIVTVVDEIIKDEMALKLLVTEMGIPAFGVFITDQEAERDKNSENILTSQLIKKGFKIKKIAGKNIDDLSGIKKQGIDFVLSGSMSSESVNMSNIYNIQNMKSIQTTLECQILDCSTAEVISAKTVAGKGAHISENTAKLKSLEDCVPKIIVYLLTGAIEIWSREVSTNLKEIALEIDNVDGEVGMEMFSFLSGKFQGVETVADKGYFDKRQLLLIRSVLSVDDLFKYINMFDKYKNKFEITRKDDKILAVVLKTPK